MNPLEFFKKLINQSKNKEKEVDREMATQDEKELKKAREDIDEKGKDSQTERDREDESVAAQERDKGEEDSQTAKDRIDESRGAKRADEDMERRDEKREIRDEDRERQIRIEEKLDRFLSYLEKREDKGDERAMEKARETYGVGNRPFGDSEREEKSEVSTKDIVDIMRRIKG